MQKVTEPWINLRQRGLDTVLLCQFASQGEMGRNKQTAFGVIACTLPQGGAMVTTMDVSLSVLHSSLSCMKTKTYLKELFKNSATNPEGMVLSFVSNVNIL